MSLDKAILEVVENKLKDGFIEKLVEEKLVKGIESALDSSFSSYGDVTKVIEKQIKSVLVPYIENYNYSEHIVKIDHVLTEVIKNSTAPHNAMMENFKRLAVTDIPKKVTVTDIFNKWKEFVAKNVETDKLEIDYDDEPTYENVPVTLEVEENNTTRSWSSRKEMDIILECEHDPNMNRSIRIYKWKDSCIEGWRAEVRADYPLNSLLYLDEFGVYLMQLSQRSPEIEVDTHGDEDYVEVESQPEPEWN